MKSYNHLWEQFISDENIELTIRNASRGKRDRKSVKRRLERPHFKDEMKAYALNFKNKPHKPKEIYDGIQRKKRTMLQILPQQDHAAEIYNDKGHKESQEDIQDRQGLSLLCKADAVISWLDRCHRHIRHV